MKQTIRRSPLDTLLDDEKREAFALFLDDRITSVSAALITFIEKRRIYECQMNDDFSWRSGKGKREDYGPSGLESIISDIFDLQNDSLNIVGGFAAFMTARSTDDIFGTDPYYAIFPEGLEDKELTDAMQRHSEWKLRTSPFKTCAMDAIDCAFGLGEGVIKQVWDVEEDVFEKSAEVLCVGETPVTTMTGEYLTKEDNIVLTQGADGAEYLMAPEKDPAFSLQVTPDVNWKEMAIEQTNILFKGIRASVMHYADFLVSPTATSLEETDFIGHRFQMRLSDAKELYGLTEEQVEKLSSIDEEDKAEVNQPREEHGEHKVEAPMIYEKDPMLELVECWVKHDPVGDGRKRRIRAIIEVSGREILEMDYMANVTPNGLLPFIVVRAYTVKNRWYGRGYYEAYEKAQEYIDRQLCRIEYRNRYHSNPAIFFQGELMEGGPDGDEIELVPGKTHRMKPGVKLEEVVQAWVYPDLDERTWQLMQFMIQVIQVRSGVTSAAQGEVSSMPSTATATGIESILASASTLSRLPIGNLKNALEKALLFAIKLIYGNMDRDETYAYFEGHERKTAILQSATVRNIDMNCHMLLTRFKQRENVEASTKGIDFHARYITLPEEEKGAARPLFVQAIKGLGFDQADTIIRPPIQIPIDPMTGLPMMPPTQPPEQNGPGPSPQ